MDIAVVDDEKAIREHICGLVEERQTALPTVFAHVSEMTVNSNIREAV